MATVNWSLQHKRDTAANWTANNPTLLAGQIGIETDNLTTTPKFKIGNGTSTWNSLPYFYGGALSAQNLSNVLSVGNTTGGTDISLTDADSISLGTTPKGYISYNPYLANPAFYISNAGGTDAISFRDAGGIYVDTTTGVYLPQLTASRLLSLDANNKVSNETGTGFLKLNAGVISYDNSSYQPLDSDLTSWAGVTRASGFDTFTATPSSANLRALLSDENGTGPALFDGATSPTFTTDITTPLIIGGTAVGSTIQYKGTTGNGTSTVAAHQFLVGNNGATTAAQVFNSGQVSIGNYASPTNLRVFTVGQDTAFVSVGSYTSVTSYGAIYMGAATPGALNYTLISNSATTFINGTSAVNTRVNNNTQLAIAPNTVIFTSDVATSGAVTPFTITTPANTGQTASTEISNFKVNGASKTWAAGAITTQRWNYFTANTAAFASASTITNSYGLYVEAATAGANATITNNWSAGFNGSVQITNVGTSGVVLNLDGSAGTGGSTNLNILRATTGVSGQIVLSTSTTNQFTIGLSGVVGTNDFVIRDSPQAATRLQILRNTVGQIGLHGVTPSALLTLAAGTATASTAPLKFTTGTNLTVAEAGVMEYNNTFHLTNSDATRRHVVLAPNTTKVTAAAPYANDGYVVINIGGTDFKVMTTA